QIGSVVESRRALVVVKTPIALHVTFPDKPRAGGNAYPQSLMGVIAFVRQAFLDAGSDAARTDPSLEAMGPAIERRLPVALEANSRREILRALRMAKELRLDPIVTGGLQAGALTADLKAQNVRVVYSLNYPQRPKPLAPDADEPLDTLRARAEAPKQAAE